MRAALLALLLSTTAVNAQVVHGFAPYCTTTSDCYAAAPVRYSGAMLELSAVNTYVNRSIYFDDIGDVWGDIRNQPGGDCEDFAIGKRNMLTARGWPRSNLVLAVRFLPRAHMVLLVYSNGTPFVLDNLTNTIVVARGEFLLEPSEGIQWRRVIL